MPRLGGGLGLVALDSETTGVDLAHGASAFLVTTCFEDGTQKYWEWFVDPLTRTPDVPEGDVDEISEVIRGADRLVLQNAKFDYRALLATNPALVDDWRWDRVDETLYSGHLLASNQPHNLTDMVAHYLGRDMEPYERRMRAAVEECRLLVKREQLIAARRNTQCYYDGWVLAHEGLTNMPSVKAGSKRDEDKPWKNDCWLPRLIAYVCEYPEPKSGCRHVWNAARRCNSCGGHEWWTVTSTYANADSRFTLPLYKRHMVDIRARGLEKLYHERLKLLPILADRDDGMETRGASMSVPRCSAALEQCLLEAGRAGDKCCEIARRYQVPCDGCNGTGRVGVTPPDRRRSIEYFDCAACDATGRVPYALVLPRGPSPTNSLKVLMFELMGFEPFVLEKSKTGEPSLGKTALDFYRQSLPPGELLDFVRALAERNQLGTDAGFHKAYLRYQRNGRIHASFGPTNTDTLRWGSNSPNLQNVGNQERELAMFGDDDEEKGRTPSAKNAFGPEPGREWVDMDAANLERRIPVYKADEKSIIDLFERPNDPPYYGSEHLMVAHILFPEIFDAECRLPDGTYDGRIFLKNHKKDGKYRNVKGVNFGIQYGAVLKKNGWGTVDRVIGIRGAHARLASRTPKLTKLNDECIRHANRHGFVETWADPSVDPDRGYPIMCARTDSGRVLETVPLNYKVQSTAVWWMCRAMVRVYAFFRFLNAGGTFAGRKWPGGYYITLQVHDSLVSDMPSGAGRGANPWDYNLPIIAHVKKLMECGGTDIGVPTPVNVTYHAENWADGVDIDVFTAT